MASIDVLFSCFLTVIFTSYREAMLESSDVDHIWLKVLELGYSYSV